MSRAKDLFSVPQAPDRTIKNQEGHAAYDRGLHERYLQMLLTNTFDNTFYTKAGDLVKEATALHQQMLREDPVFMAKALVFARTHGFMRLAPIYGLVAFTKVAGDHFNVRSDVEAEQYDAKALFNAAFAGVIRIPSDLAEFLTILKGQTGSHGGRRVKEAIARFLTAKTSEYWALKYNGSGRGYSLGDAVALAHPKPKAEWQNNIFRYLRGQKPKLEHSVGANSWMDAGLEQIGWFEALKQATTDAERIKAIKQGRLPHDVITATVQKPSVAVWKAIMEQMPIFALLRHLNTLERHGVLKDDAARAYIRQRLTDKEALQKSMILPYQFVTAFHQVNDNQMRDVLRQAIELTFANLPELEGTTAIFLDRSGSMGPRMNNVIMTASVFALALYKKTGGNGPVWAFNQNVYDLQPSMVDSIMTQAQKVTTDGGTDCSAPMKFLNEKRIRVDNIIMLTDEQENGGAYSWSNGTGRYSKYLYDEFLTYRRDINKNAKLFVVNMAPEKGSLAPSSDPQVFSIYGMSDQVLRYIAMAQEGFGSMVNYVKGMTLDVQ